MLLRTLQVEDVPFIYSSYLKSMRPSKSYIANDTYYHFEHRRMEQLLLSSITVVLVDPEDENHIIGWAMASIVPEVHVAFHYCYVKHSYRGRGLAHTLINSILDNVEEGLPRLCSSHTPAFCKLSNKYGLEFNPYYFDYTLGV